MKRNKILICGTTWINHEDVTLSERSLTQLKAAQRTAPLTGSVQSGQIRRDRKQVSDP